VQGGGESPTPAGSDPAAAAATTPSSPASTANVADSAASSAAAAAAARSAKEEDAAHSAETAKLMEDLVAKEVRVCGLVSVFASLDSSPISQKWF